MYPAGGTDESTDTLHDICQALEKMICDTQHPGTKLVLHTSQDPKHVTNAIIILGSFLCLHLGAPLERRQASRMSATSDLRDRQTAEMDLIW